MQGSCPEDFSIFHPIDSDHVATTAVSGYHWNVTSQFVIYFKIFNGCVFQSVVLYFVRFFLFCFGITLQ